jgi:NAD(P)-dependent dehydrogenase (short-subunit alcohol dehydrogenase family)
MSMSTPSPDPSLQLLHGRHALITGAGRGIGAAIARALAGAGAAVTLAGRSRDALDALAAELHGRSAAPGRGAASGRGAAVHVMSMDVTDEGSVRAGCAGAEAALGPIAILVNNAGAAESAPLARMGRDHWDRMLAVNLTGPFLCCRAVLPGMLDRSFGRIVNIASTAGLRGYAYVAAYSAAKHGVIGLTRSLALETARRGITVNAICPGYTQTDMLERTVANIQAKTGRTAEEARAELVRGNPQGRLIQPEEVASAVLWLCAPGSESVTGQSIAVAGGEVM